MDGFTKGYLFTDKDKIFWEAEVEDNIRATYELVSYV